MNIRIDPARITSGADAIASRAADMAVRRLAIERSVDSLLTGWRGDAAAAFEAQWQEWRADADRVIDGLAASTDALRCARDDLSSGDVSVGETQDRIRGRLG
ncbi:MAG: WXG100 family type VII secretion target [Nocardioides sp.]|uniref:WXG100 family type VII secretion target n=1 Tax=Nocardioides sp. TaxID=35761 RepID=UPI0032655866